MRRPDCARVLGRGRALCPGAAEKTGSSPALASARAALSKQVLCFPSRALLRCTSRQLTSAPRETRTPTRHAPDKALNLGSWALVVSSVSRLSALEGVLGRCGRFVTRRMLPLCCHKQAINGSRDHSQPTARERVRKAAGTRT